jgi:hypothetical protein
MWQRAKVFLDNAHANLAAQRPPKREDFAWAVKRWDLSPEEFEEWAEAKGLPKEEG